MISFGLIKIDFLSPTGSKDTVMTGIPGVKTGRLLMMGRMLEVAISSKKGLL